MAAQFCLTILSLLHSGCFGVHPEPQGQLVPPAPLKMPLALQPAPAHSSATQFKGPEFTSRNWDEFLWEPTLVFQQMAITHNGWAGGAGGGGLRTGGTGASPAALPNPGGRERGGKRGRESKPMNNRLLKSSQLESAYTGEGKRA